MKAIPAAVTAGIVLSLVSLPSVASAATNDGASKFDEAQVAIEITARVKERCGISGDAAQAVQNPRIDQPQSLTFPFRIDCNAPFAIGANSLHGGLLKIGDETAARQGFAVLKPYDVSLTVETDGDALRSQPCNSRLLDASGDGQKCAFFGRAPGEGLSSQQRIAPDRNGTVTVRWNGDADENGRRLAAGEYQDVITVVVGVQI